MPKTRGVDEASMSLHLYCSLLSGPSSAGSCTQTRHRQAQCLHWERSAEDNLCWASARAQQAKAASQLVSWLFCF